MKARLLFTLFGLLSLATAEEPTAPGKPYATQRVVKVWGGPRTPAPPEDDIIPECICALPCDRLPDFPKTKLRREVDDVCGIDLPVPSPERLEFSRWPVLPYIDKDKGALVLEAVMPPLCRNGVLTFYQQIITLSPDGKEMNVWLFRIYAPGRGEVTKFHTTRTTSTPYIFRTSAGCFIFKCNGAEIIECDRYKETQNEGEWSRIRFYPTDKKQKSLYQI